MKEIYMAETLNFIYNEKGKEDFEDIVSKGKIVESKELKTSYLVIEEKIEENE